ncbi:MAG: hypothetical protein CENE_03016 [Candidatus Celerinatantimonas neptuna]|nr:MAG: hypothetical protein CENE_03016 [Candidatus Celerinatantimonas neptuna]
MNDAAGAAKTVYQYNYLKHKDLVKAIAAQRAYNHCTWGHAHCSVKQLTALHNTLNGYRKKSLQNSQWVQSVCKADSGSAACQRGIQDLNSYAADVKHFDAQPKGPAMLAASPYRYNTRQALGFDDLALQKAFKTGLAAGDSPKQIVEHYQSQLAEHNELVNTGVNVVLAVVAPEASEGEEAAESAVTEEAGVWPDDVNVNRNAGLELNPKTGKWEHSGENADITASEGSIDKGLTQELSEDGLGDVTDSTVQANKAAGDAARDAIAARTGGVIEQNFRVPGGLRRVDVLDGTTAIESKVGRTGLTKRVRQELARDVKMLRSGQVDRVQWEFSRSGVTGKSGPTGPLRQKLEKFGIDIVE